MTRESPHHEESDDTAEDLDIHMSMAAEVISSIIVLLLCGGLATLIYFVSNGTI